MTAEPRAFAPDTEPTEAGAQTLVPGVRPVTLRDCLDLLARHYYNDDRLWWRIADANPEFVYAGDMLLTKDLVEVDGELVETDDPPPDARIVRESMVGRAIVIPRAREQR